MEFFLVLLFINYCISFHTNNYKPTFAPAVCSLLFKERDCGPTFICYKIVKGDAKGAVSETPFPCKSSAPSETHSTQSSQRLCPMCDLRSAAQIWSDRKWRLFSLAQTCTFSSSTQMSQFCRWAKTRVKLKGPEWTLNLSTQNYQRMAWMYIYPMVRLLFKKLLLNLAVFYQQWLSEARWHHYDLSVYSLTFKMCGFHLKSVIYPLPLPIQQTLTTIFTVNKFLMHRKVTSADVETLTCITSSWQTPSSWAQGVHEQSREDAGWLLGDGQGLRRNSVRLISWSISEFSKR